MSPSESKWIRVSPNESEWIQVNPNGSKWIQVRPSPSPQSSYPTLGGLNWYFICIRGRPSSPSFALPFLPSFIEPNPRKPDSCNPTHVVHQYLSQLTYIHQVFGAEVCLADFCVPPDLGPRTKLNYILVWGPFCYQMGSCQTFWLKAWWILLQTT